MKDYYTVDPCSTSDAYEIKFIHAFNMKKSALAFGKMGEVLAETPVVLVVKSKDVSMSVYATGRIMVTKIDKKKAGQLAKRIHLLLKEFDCYEA